jgi:hypothetical protein
MPYSLKYGQKNINDIRHILFEGINSVGHWETDLRHYKNYEFHHTEPTMKVESPKETAK